MMARNPNVWGSLTNESNLHPHQESHQLSSSSSTSSFLSSPLYFYVPSSVSSFSSTSMADHQSNQARPWSQLLLGSSGLPNDQERYGTSELFRYNNRMENWEENVINNQSSSMIQMIDENQEVNQNHNFFGHVTNDEYHHQVPRNSWAHNQLNLVSSPTSCVTILSSNLLNFSSSNKQEGRRERSDNSTEGNNSRGLPNKKARVQYSSTQPALKVRKEKLGDRITALHQLVSPFGKTDTASVLSEAIGYIRFLLAQIEGHSSPYLVNVSKSMGQQHSVQGRNCLYPMEPGQDGQGTHLRDLKSRGLCLVPVSCTQHVGNDNNSGADYWAPALGGGF